MKDFELFESVSVNLQRKGLLIHDARYILDKICDGYPITSKYLAQNAEIVHKPFEKAVVKIINGVDNDLMHLERSSVETLLKVDCDNEVENFYDAEKSYFESILAKRRKFSSVSSYINM